jgi:hypothetical protein
MLTLLAFRVIICDAYADEERAAKAATTTRKMATR